MIAKFNKTSLKSGLLALVLFLGLACVSLTDAAQDTADEFKVETTTNEKGWWVDKVDYPFVSDPQLSAHLDPATVRCSIAHPNRRYVGPVPRPASGPHRLGSKTGRRA